MTDGLTVGEVNTMNLLRSLIWEWARTGDRSHRVRAKRIASRWISFFPEGERRDARIKIAKDIGAL